MKQLTHLPGARGSQKAPRAGQLAGAQGQALLLVAMMMTALLLFAGLGVDAAFLMARRAKLQSAVDASALSAAQQLVNNGAGVGPGMRAEQILMANGVQVTSTNLDSSWVPGTTLAPSRLFDMQTPTARQAYVRVVERVDTFFIRLLPAFRTVNISAEATADSSSYAEIQAKPYGIPGVVSELNLMVWGRDSHRGTGDAYSPNTIDGLSANSEYGQQPYGYLFRIDVPANYPSVTGSTRLTLEIFDADTYNRPGNPPAFQVPPPSDRMVAADMYASCSALHPSSGICTSDDGDTQVDDYADTGVKLDAFQMADGSRRPAFWRVDEYRRTHTRTRSYNHAYSTNTQYTLWHFDPLSTTAFDDPAVLSDQPSWLARYTIKSDQSVATDLRWYRPSGFDVNLNSFQQEANGGWYFYLYVQGLDGSSENNYDLRVGPPQTLSCSNPASTYCYVNRYYLDLQDGFTTATWQTGGATIFAKRALPLNLITGVSFPLIFTQVSSNAAGQTLGVRHFDQDCNGGCARGMQYQMQLCGCNNLSSDSCWADIGQGWVGPDNGWVNAGYADPERIQIPAEDTSQFRQFFGSGSNTCDSSWMRLRRHPSYSQDTTVWELPFFRPRLIR